MIFFPFYPEEQRKREKEEERKQKEEQKDLERKQKEEQKELERKQKEEQKELERKRKDEQKEEERKKKEEQKELDRKQKEEQKELERKQKEEQKELERKRKEEEKRLKDQAEQSKYRKTAEAFVKFFVPKKVDQKGDSESGEKMEVDQTQNFMSFQVKEDMMMAPITRRTLNEEERSAFNQQLLSNVGKNDLYLNQLKTKTLVTRKSSRTCKADGEQEKCDDDDDDDIYLIGNFFYTNKIHF